MNEGSNLRNVDSVLFISYFASIRGNCPAEWADDKLRVLDANEIESVLVTGFGSHVKFSERPATYRVPTLSKNDFKIERQEAVANGDRLSITAYLFWPFALTVGWFNDLILKFVTKGLSAGRWPWLVSAFPVALWALLSKRCSVIFATGGPMSAQVVGAVLALITRKKLVIEFQDPLLGSNMTRSEATRGIASRLETWLIKQADLVVYVTEDAARQSRDRNPNFGSKIKAVYPGAWRFDVPKKVEARIGSEIELLHLGTLYSTRNLDAFFQALDQLKIEGFAPAQHVKVVNLGAVYCETVSKYRQRADFVELEAKERQEAIERAAQSDGLLLIQHTDELSKETIPYKTYDYLNLEIPVFGILNNEELASMVIRAGGSFGVAGDAESLNKALRAYLLNLTNGEKSSGSQIIDIETQFLGLL